MQDNDFSAHKNLYLKAARENLRLIKKTDVLIDDAHRAAHNLKAESLLMGYAATAALSGLIENIFYKVKTGALSLSPAISDALAQAAGGLEKSFDLIEKSDREADLSEITTHLKKTAEAI